MGYPKWLYHASEKPRILKSEEEQKALGKGWEETPAAFEKKTEKPASEKPRK